MPVKDSENQVIGLILVLNDVITRKQGATRFGEK